MRTRQSPRAPLTPVALQAALRAFAPRHVRVMRDASRAPYCFVDFPDAAAAKRAMDAFGGSARGAFWRWRRVAGYRTRRGVQRKKESLNEKMRR